MTETQTQLFEQVIIAGFGGQGIMLAGKLLAQAAMESGKEVTYMPSYGAEVRGGTAKSMVIIGDEPIGCPIVAHPDSLIIMNKASMEKFLPKLNAKGLLIYNSSLIDEKPQTNDADVLAIPADDLAIELNNIKVANMIAIGAYAAKQHFLDINVIAQSLSDVLAKRYHHTIEVNQKALHIGAEYAKKT